jgi:Ribbon-helix-helix protein, copG family
MHRTQIYLQDELHATLKANALSQGITMSELIRRTLEKDVVRNPSVEARAFFERLAPLESFNGVDSASYVSVIRSKSRILRPKARK